MLAIGGLGLGGCLLLSMMMQHLLEVKKDNDRPAVIIEIEELFGSRFSKPAQMTFLGEAPEARADLELQVLTGLRKARVAHTAGDMVWRRCAASHGLAEVHVVVRDEDGGVEEFDVPKPRIRGLRPGGGLDLKGKSTGQKGRSPASTAKPPAGGQ